MTCLNWESKVCIGPRMEITAIKPTDKASDYVLQGYELTWNPTMSGLIPTRIRKL